MFKKILYLLVIVFSLGVLVSCQETTQTTTTTITTEDTSYVLPDLAGFSKLDIRNELDNLGINYEFLYETNADLAEDTFISYVDFFSGDTVSANQIVTVKISTTKLVLPDLTGMNQNEILLVMLGLGISFEFEAVTNNEVLNGTFSAYEELFEAGDLVSSTYTVTVYIGYNQTKLPDLSGMIKEEIEKVLTELNISYNFEYIVNDDYTEDTFIGYKDFEINDYYDSGIVTVNLYKNTFTDNETSLLISKYIDGGDGTSNQAIELFNATSENIDLSDYYLTIYTNGSFDVSYTIPLESVELLPGMTYLISNSAAEVEILGKADLSTTDLVFDGNDTIQLCYTNGTYIDTIYGLGDNAFVMDNEIFSRGEDIVSGTRDYSYTEWYGFIPTYTTIIGTHPVTLPDTFTIEITSRGFDDPMGGMDLVTLVYTNDGDTASFTPGFRDDERVRFLGVDTPETYPTTDLWGPEAKAYTVYILDNALRIYIQSDPELGYSGSYGRHLGLVWVDLGTEGIDVNHYDLEGNILRVEHLSGWILLNYQIVLNGYSYNYYGSESLLSFENRYLFRWFEEAERSAEENGYGIHS